MTDIFIGRQPIFDIDLSVYGYELLFRNSADQENANVVDGDSATSQVMLNTFIDIGLNSLVGKHKAFINLTQYFLEDINRISVPPGQVVLEVLEDVDPNDRVIDTLSNLKSMGHTIALDDFVFAEHLRPMVDLSDIVKIDVMALSNDEIEQHVTELRRFDLKLLAEKVETYEEFNFLKGLGFDYYQGYFFAKPTVVTGAGLKPNKASILQLVAKVNDPNIEIEELSGMISRDISLSHKVMKLVNSAASGVRVEAESIHRAVVLLGMNTIRNWVSLVALTAGSDKPHELSTLALIRARTCFMLARAANLPKADNFFTVGLFSILDAMLDQPLALLLKDLPLSEDMKTSLVELDGVYGEAISCVIAMELDELENIRFRDLSMETIAKLYLDALSWSDQQSKEISS
jgi:EAL and modified HD-GYP domain-containing signal transduction protein